MKNLLIIQSLALLAILSVFADDERQNISPEAIPSPDISATEADPTRVGVAAEDSSQTDTEDLEKPEVTDGEPKTTGPGKMAEQADTEPAADDSPKTDSPADDPENLALAARAESLKQIIADEVGKIDLENGKKLQLRSMAFTAYEENKLSDLWPKPLGEEGTAAVELAFKSFSALLAEHYFEKTGLSFGTDLPVLAEDSPVSIEDLYITLGLAETCLRMKQGPETSSEWPNWTFGDHPLPKSTNAHYDEITARFGKIAAGAKLPVEAANEFVPKNWVYLRLHQELQKDIELSEPPSIEIEGLIKVGNEFTQAKELADYLVQEGFLAETALAELDDTYTIALSEAVRDYQKTNDLQSDGILGPSTAKRISQKDEDIESRLITNLHRARRLPDAMGDRYLLANLPSGEIYGVSNDEETIRMRIVFGKDKPGQQTPLFRDELETVVFRPYWNVPFSIAVGESQYSDLEYLSNNGFKIISSSSGAALPMAGSSLSQVIQRTAYVRQDGGDSNALGLVKFLFPNKHAVYFHDTPSKHLFNKSYRAYSHGCVRLQDPEAMANWVLQDYEEWNKDSIHKALHEGERTQIELTDHIPVFIVYFTAFPDPKTPDVVKVHRDYYDYDKPGAIVDAPGPKTKPAYSSPLEEEERRGPFSIFRKNRTSNNSNRPATDRPSSTTPKRPLLERLRALQN